MTSTEGTILCWTRRVSLWAFLVSAFVVLVITILETWNVLETTEQSLWGYGDPNAWGRIENTFTIIMVVSLFVLLTLLVAKYAKKDDSVADVAKASVTKAAASTATVVKSTAKTVKSTATEAAKKAKK